MAFDKGYLSPYFMTDPKKAECVLEDVNILIHEKKISNLADFLPMLNKVATSGQPLLIIAEDIDSEALAALVVNRLRGVIQVCGVKAPGFGDRRKAMLGDIAALTNGTFFSEDLGRNLEDIELSELWAQFKQMEARFAAPRVVGCGGYKPSSAAGARYRGRGERRAEVL